MTYKNGRRSEMTFLEQKFARLYDRIRKRKLRGGSPYATKVALETLDEVAAELLIK